MDKAAKHVGIVKSVKTDNNGNSNDYVCDVQWSLGCVFWRLMNGTSRYLLTH
jgi:hypothetical protein